MECSVKDVVFLEITEMTSADLFYFLDLFRKNMMQSAVLAAIPVEPKNGEGPSSFLSGNFSKAQIEKIKEVLLKERGINLDDLIQGTKQKQEISVCAME